MDFTKSDLRKIQGIASCMISANAQSLEEAVAALPATISFSAHHIYAAWSRASLFTLPKWTEPLRKITNGEDWFANSTGEWVDIEKARARIHGIRGITQQTWYAWSDVETWVVCRRDETLFMKSLLTKECNHLRKLNGKWLVYTGGNQNLPSDCNPRTGSLARKHADAILAMKKEQFADVPKESIMQSILKIVKA